MATSDETQVVVQSSPLLKLLNEVLQMILVECRNEITIRVQDFREGPNNAIIDSRIERTCKRLLEHAKIVRARALDRTLIFKYFEYFPKMITGLCVDQERAWLRNSITSFKLDCDNDLYDIPIDWKLFLSSYPKLTEIEFWIGKWRRQCHQSLYQAFLPLDREENKRKFVNAIVHDTKQALEQNARIGSWYIQHEMMRMKSELYYLATAYQECHRETGRDIRIGAIFPTEGVDSGDAHLYELIIRCEHREFFPTWKQYDRSESGIAFLSVRGSVGEVVEEVELAGSE